MPRLLERVLKFSFLYDCTNYDYLVLYLSSTNDLAMYASTQVMVDFSLEKKFPLYTEDF